MLKSSATLRWAEIVDTVKVLKMSLVTSSPELWMAGMLQQRLLWA